MANVEAIVTKQVRTWVGRLERATREGRRELHWPVITISREFGARGAALAERVGEVTGFSTWNRELVQAIAQDNKASDEIVASLDERRRKSVEDAVLGALMGSRVTNVQYLRSLMRIVQTISVHGSAIIVGRGANCVLRPGDALRIRVVCPLDKRVRQYASLQEMGEKEARTRITRMDADRADFVRHQFKRDVADASEYDVVLNSGTFDMDEMAELVLSAYERKFGRRPPTTKT